MRPPLRDYQISGIQGIRTFYSRGRKRVLFVLATGGGKTTVAAEIVRASIANGKRVLFLAHRRELITQASARLDAFGIDHGIIMADHPRRLPEMPVQVASVQTLTRRELPHFDLIIIDEAHRAKADSYGKILERLPGAFVLGLTATPWRADGRGLGDGLFDEIVVGATPRDLTERGFLTPITGFAFSQPDLRGVKKRGNDYDEKGLSIVMGGTKIMGSIVDEYLRHARGESFVLFAVNVEHSRQCTERFRAAGIPTEHLDAKTPEAERDAILARVRSRETLGVCNVGILTEGWDMPSLTTCILARPTMSVALYLQMVGRALRPVCFDCGAAALWTEPACTRCGSANVKRKARVHDHAGCILAHGLPDAERDYSLNGEVRRKSKRDLQIPTVRACKQCFALFDPRDHDACPECGAASKRVSREIREVKDAKAIAIEKLAGRGTDSPETEALKRAFLESQLRKAAEAGHRPGWARERYRARFGEPPPVLWMAQMQVDMQQRRSA